jgi:hypothetical protein
VKDLSSEGITTETVANHALPGTRTARTGEFFMRPARYRVHCRAATSLAPCAKFSRAKLTRAKLTRAKLTRGKLPTLVFATVSLRYRIAAARHFMAPGAKLS